ncbi:MAG: PBP1A family penicillin-binding protein [Eubacterium sp.]|nr:PBP1A family penicillin-binding protein [Eubacterium sp.]
MRNEEKAVRQGLPRKTKPKKKMPAWKIVLITILALFVLGCGSVFAFYQANRYDISGDTYQMKEKTQVYSADNQIIAELYTENRTYVSLDQIPKDLQNALIATEDSHFYSHGGIDYFGMVRAMVSNVLSGSATGQGASTITQQLARVLYDLDLADEQTITDSFSRKFKEISIAWQLEDKYSKDQILEMYLNEYYFGSAAYGVQAAAQTYFGKNVSDLNLAECAMIAGLPQAPTAYAPNTNFEAAKKRQSEVLERMVKEGYITQEQSDQAAATELTIMPWSETDINNQIRDGYDEFVSQALQEYAEYAAPAMMKERGLSEDEAVEQIRSDISSGGYKIYTTINTNYQATAVDAVTSALENYGMTPETGDTGALVTVDQSGAVRAYYAGTNDYNQVDIADSPHQPGSNIKPLYYSGVFEKGIHSPSDTVVDEPTSFGGYTPQNYGGGYSGTVTLTQALVRSLNIPAVKVFNDFGVDNALEWMKTFGITTFVNPGEREDGYDDYNLSSALGGLTEGIKPLEMAAAFNVFNNGGVYNEPYFVEKIERTNGQAVFEKSQLGLDSHRVMSEETASTMWEILRQVVTSGTGTSAANGMATAGKTGTTDAEWDLWFTGMTGNLSSSIWVGNTEHQEVGAGSYVPAGIYGSYMRALVNNNLVGESTDTQEATPTAAPAATPTPEATPEATVDQSQTYEEPQDTTVPEDTAGEGDDQGTTEETPDQGGTTTPPDDGTSEPTE